jgi:mRNA-degrading endonuclease RelE of RelBE toxin-antitoxin system
MEVRKKMDQIVSMDEASIDHYKNLRYGLSDWKRVHVGKSYVLFFRVYKKEGIVLFQKLMHHDDAYRR